MNAASPRLGDSFYFLKRNMFSKGTALTKVSGFIGYIVPVLLCASQTWYPTESDLRHIEKVEKGNQIDNRKINWLQRVTLTNILHFLCAWKLLTCFSFYRFLMRSTIKTQKSCSSIRRRILDEDLK